MTESENTGPESIARAVIQRIMDNRGADPVDITHESRISEDLGLDSLEIAELSASLEDDLGSDPYTDGLFPATFGELVQFYG